MFSSGGAREGRPAGRPAEVDTRQRCLSGFLGPAALQGPHYLGQGPLPCRPAHLRQQHLTSRSIQDSVSTWTGSTAWHPAPAIGSPLLLPEDRTRRLRKNTHRTGDTSPISTRWTAYCRCSCVCPVPLNQSGAIPAATVAANSSQLTPVSSCPQSVSADLP